LNANTTKEPGEAGIGTVTVTLYDSTGTIVIATTTTAANGTYSFANVPPGDYRVVETDPAGYVSTTPNLVPVTVTSGGNVQADFGEYRLVNTSPASINGTVWNDLDADGVIDPGESPLVGVTVTLRDNLGNVVATALTNASGQYSFTNLVPGAYSVTETDPATYVSTTLNTVVTTLNAGDSSTINFGDRTGAPVAADPAVTKNGSPDSATVGEIVVYTITVGNNGTGNATGVVLTDTKPSFLDIISITISPNPGLTPVISGNTFTINFGTVTPTDLYTVTVVTRVNSLGAPPGGDNIASVVTTSNGDVIANNAASARLQILISPSALPATGFAPNRMTILPPKPESLTYNALAADGLVLEIPALGVKTPIVGVPYANGTWDVRWLGSQAGYLDGTAFPTWNGNSVITAHVYNYNGKAGPFVYLNQLRWGDKVIIHAFGQKYTYEVRTTAYLKPTDTKSVLKHEDKAWVTLLTCREFDEKTNTYKRRVAVKAVLVSVENEK
jgi:LPXTG-site transpeptidase (sortase) family protein